MTQKKNGGYETPSGVIEHVADDAEMLVGTLPPAHQHPVMGALACMLAATRHARAAMEANGEEQDPALTAVCEQVARLVLSQVGPPDDIPPAFRQAWPKE